MFFNQSQSLIKQSTCLSWYSYNDTQFTPPSLFLLRRALCSLLA